MKYITTEEQLNQLTNAQLLAESWLDYNCEGRPCNTGYVIKKLKRELGITEDLANTAVNAAIAEHNLVV